MRLIARLVRGLWSFIVGDDWRAALGIAIAIGITAILADAGTAAWWVMPVGLFVVLVVSLRRAE
jgi:hypothetical protein